MSLSRFFLDESLMVEEGKATFVLGPDQYHHFNVLRIKPGEHIALVDATKRVYELEIESVLPDGISARVISAAVGENRSPVSLFCGISKGERMDLTIRATTEIGVSLIVPVMMERCVVRFSDASKAEAKAQRWRKIALSSAEQSGRTLVAEVLDPLSLSEAIALLPDYDVVIVAWEDKETGSIKQVLKDAAETLSKEVSELDVALFIGPEGGLSSQEIDLLEAAGARTVSLGETILRTETACIVATALVLHETGGLGNSL